jgi:outer membrane immunogenic protein
VNPPCAELIGQVARCLIIDVENRQTDFCGSFLGQSGVEAQADWTKLQASNAQPLAPTILNNSKTDSLGTIAARFGMTWDRTLLYAKGGTAWAHDTFWTSNSACVPGNICQSVTTTRWGWMAGAGVELALTPNWSAKLEYNHLDFGNRTETLANVAAGGPFEYNVRQTTDLVEAGVNYRFNWGIR